LAGKSIFKPWIQIHQPFKLLSACWNCSKGELSACSRAQCVTADGVERGLLTINRQLPSPPIQVCLKDIVVVDVTNHMDGSSTAIHWHGLRQKGSIFSDGVSFITQCPIQFGNTFRYTYEANDPGTNFYHSHSGLQKANGIYGALIIRIPEKSNLFDHDPPQFFLIVSDW
jgi:FtsP/CotA-like multicopper oxidase with cupredoxin domain